MVTVTASCTKGKPRKKAARTALADVVETFGRAFDGARMSPRPVVERYARAFRRAVGR